MLNRKNTRQVCCGGVMIGGDAPITVQSMLNTDPHDETACLQQAQKLQEAGCEILRMTVPDEQAAKVLGVVRQTIAIPVVADIHFDYRCALAALDNGAHKLRINPGNIGGEDRVRAVATAAKGCGAPIRIGVNSGSVSKDMLTKYDGPTAQAMVESAIEHCRLLEDVGFEDIVVSLKASDISRTVEACTLFAQQRHYPLHLGITEAGTLRSGLVTSSAGLTLLLSSGLGDTLRISLSADPVDEVRAGHLLLQSLGLRKKGSHVVSCPTCGRCKINVIGMAETVEDHLAKINTPLTVAVMGCAVNGPGEAREADIGLAGGDGKAIIFKKGEIVKTVKEEEALSALLAEINQYVANVEEDT